MVSHVLFDFFGTLVEYAPFGPDHDFGRSHRMLRDMGGSLGYADYCALWIDAGERFDAEADRTGIRSFLIDPGRVTQVPDQARLSSVLELIPALAADLRETS
jgi:hypothetical protein